MAGKHGGGYGEARAGQAARQRRDFIRGARETVQAQHRWPVAGEKNR